MDDELKGTTLKQSFARAEDAGNDDGDDGDDDRDEVDDAVNFMSSMMESVSSQLGGAGPVTNMFGDMSVLIPKHWRQAEQQSNSQSQAGGGDSK